MTIIKRIKYFFNNQSEILALKRENKELKSIQNVSDILIETRDLDGVLEMIRKKLEELGYKFSGFFLINKEKTYLFPPKVNIPKVVMDLLETALKKPYYEARFYLNDERNIMARAVKDRAIQVSDSVSSFTIGVIDDKTADIIQKVLHVKTVIAIPLFVKGDIVGLLAISSSKDFTESEKGILITFANQAAIAIYTANLFKEVEIRKEELSRINENLEKKIEERTQELNAKVMEIEKWYHLTVGRELRMAELKKKIKELEKNKI